MNKAYQNTLANQNVSLKPKIDSESYLPIRCATTEFKKLGPMKDLTSRNFNLMQKTYQILLNDKDFAYQYLSDIFRIDTAQK